MSLRAACALGFALLPACFHGVDLADLSDSEPASTSSPMSSGDLPMSGDPTTTSGDATTSTASTETGDTSSASTALTPFCGDSMQDPGEECDYGRNNSDIGSCTLSCKHATCGDSLVWDGVEQCDLGPANAKEYGGCTPSCELAARCGDGNLDLGYEECDQGDLNGSGEEVDGNAACSATCRWQGRLVFLSSATYPGDLGGLSGADLKCQALAASAGLADPHTFRAWLSDGAHSPQNRFTTLDLLGAPYVLLNGRIVADTFVELIDLGPRTGISITETGQSVANAYVWTNTTAFGEAFSPTNHCNEWTAASLQFSARRGLNALSLEEGPAFDTWRSERHWTSVLSQTCNVPYRLYCFEDA